MELVFLQLVRIGAFVPSAEEEKDNQLVCALYGLTDEEKAMVKGEI